MQPDELIQAARGLRPCDLLLANGRIVDVFSGEVHPGGVAVAGGRILARLPLPVAGLMSRGAGAFGERRDGRPGARGPGSSALRSRTRS